MERASWVTSAPAASQTSDIALMNEILVARNALADLHQLGRGEVGDHDRDLAVLGERQVEHALVGRVEHAGRPLRLDAENDAVGPQHVLDGHALLQELGAPGHLDAEIGGRVAGHELLDPLGGADRDGRLADNERLAGQVRRQVGHGALHVREVRGHAVGALRGADADEVDVAELGNLGIRGGEPQPTGRQVLAEQLVEAGLVERNVTAGQLGDLGLVDVEADHLIAELREADCVGRAEISGAQKGQPGPRRTRGRRNDGWGAGVRDGHA